MNEQRSRFSLAQLVASQDNQAYLCAAALLFCSFSAQLALRAQTARPDLKNPEVLFAAALASNALAGDGLKPGRMKASYDISDKKGKVVATGVFEEWWAAKTSGSAAIPATITRTLNIIFRKLTFLSICRQDALGTRSRDSVCCHQPTMED